MTQQLPLRRKPSLEAPRPDPARPKIWAEGDQRPRFDAHATARALWHLARVGAGQALAWTAVMGRRVAVNVRDGVGRIPEDRLGRFARFVPSHLRVAAWLKNVAAVIAHGSATADPDIRRGNALVARVEPHLWALDPVPSDPVPEAEPASVALDGPVPAEPAPVVLPEPMPDPVPDPVSESVVADDPLASIRGELSDQPPAPRGKAKYRPRVAENRGPAVPPGPPGPVATAAIQVTGYLLGWAVVGLALPYGLGHALWLHLKGVDLRQIGDAG
jgi:hypothetical protein